MAWLESLKLSAIPLHQGFLPRHISSPNVTGEPCGLPAERLTLRPGPTPAAATESLPGQAARSPPSRRPYVAPGRPASSPTGRRRRDPGTRRPGSRRRPLKGSAVGGPQRAAAAGHGAWRRAAPRGPGPRPHHKPQLALLWGKQSVTERASGSRGTVGSPGGARTSQQIDVRPAP